MRTHGSKSPTFVHTKDFAHEFDVAVLEKDRFEGCLVLAWRVEDIYSSFGLFYKEPFRINVG